MLPESLDDTNTSDVNLNVYNVIVGIVSSLMGGISYCFIRAGAKASDQPVYGVHFLHTNPCCACDADPCETYFLVCRLTVFAFAIIATPFTALSALVFQVKLVIVNVK